MSDLLVDTCEMLQSWGPIVECRPATYNGLYWRFRLSYGHDAELYYCPHGDLGIYISGCDAHGVTRYLIREVRDLERVRARWRELDRWHRSNLDISEVR